MSGNSIFDVPYSNGVGCCTNNTNSNNSSTRNGEQTSTRPPATKSHVISVDGTPVEDMSVLVANEMNKLSFQEREVVYEDLHGVSKPADEPQARIEESIAETRRELATMRVKPAYNKAAFLHPEYVESDAFILMFLRSCKFDPKQTAKKIAEHFRHKLELFGYENLGKDLMYDDLDEGTKNAIASGAVQVLPQRDNSGRAIVFFAFDVLSYDQVDSQLRAIWYIMMCNLKAESMQRNGTVQVSYNVEYSDNSLHLDLLLKSSMIAKAMPQKILGVHFCYDNEVVKPVLSMLQMIVGTSARLRFRSHFGSYVEVKYSLQNFGIPHDTLPTDVHGKMDCSKIRTFVEEQKQIDEERKEKEAGLIMHPGCEDVLMGRGWHQQEHPGNLELARIVDEHREEYKTARKLQKTQLNRKIVEMIKTSGGRFLERSQPSDACGGVGWIQVTDDNARDKVSKNFRTMPKRNKSQANNEDAPMEPEQILERSQPSDARGGIGWIQVTDDNARDKVSKNFRTMQKRNKSQANSEDAPMEPEQIPSYVPADDNDHIPKKKARVAI